MRIIKEPIKVHELIKIAKDQFGDLVKAVLDIEKEIMVVGGELHADEETLLSDSGSKREDTWGVNLYLEKSGDEWIEFDSMINIKPHYGNRSRGVNDLKIQAKIRKIVDKLIIR